MDIQSFINRLIEIFEEANPDTIKPQTNFRDIEGYSSLEAFLIISMVMDVYKITFCGDDIRESVTVEDIFSIVESRMLKSENE